MNDVPIQDRQESAGDRFLLKMGQLSPDKITERGEMVLGGAAQIVRIEDIERIKWSAPLELIYPNPDQPREYFDPQKLAELRATIGEVGQRTAIGVVPIQFSEPPADGGPAVRLFVIDGERRLKVLTALEAETAFVDVTWAATFHEVFFESLILNESRASHNHIERAKAYEVLIEEARKKGESRPAEYVAYRLGIHFTTIYSHLRLLRLPEKIQQMVARKEIPQGRALQLSSTLRQLGENGDAVKQARAMLDALDSNEVVTEEGEGDEVGRAKGDLSRKALKAARQKALIDGTELGARVEAGLAVTTIVNATNAVRRAARRASEIDGVVLRDALRERAMQPPEDLVRRLQETQTRIEELLSMVEPATRPETLEIIQGAPTFVELVNGATFPRRVHKEVALLLAKLSDENREVMTASEIASALMMEVHQVGGILAKSRLREILEKLGLEVDTNWSKGKRVQSKPGVRSRSEFRRVQAYRLRRIEKDEPKIAPELAAALAAESAAVAPAAAPKPAAPAAKPAAPAAKPAAPAAKPTAPAAKPATPAAKPAVPAAKPTAPATKPAAPAAKPTASAAKPAAPAAKPAAPAAKPAVQFPKNIESVLLPFGLDGPERELLAEFLESPRLTVRIEGNRRKYRLLRDMIRKMRPGTFAMDPCDNKNWGFTDVFLRTIGVLSDEAAPSRPPATSRPPARSAQAVQSIPPYTGELPPNCSSEKFNDYCARVSLSVRERAFLLRLMKGESFQIPKWEKGLKKATLDSVANKMGSDYVEALERGGGTTYSIKPKFLKYLNPKTKDVPAQSKPEGQKKPEGTLVSTVVIPEVSAPPSSSKKSSSEAILDQATNPVNPVAKLPGKFVRLSEVDSGRIKGLARSALKRVPTDDRARFNGVLDAFGMKGRYSPQRDTVVFTWRPGGQVEIRLLQLRGDLVEIE